MFALSNFLINLHFSFQHEKATSQCEGNTPEEKEKARKYVFSNDPVVVFHLPVFLAYFVLINPLLLCHLYFYHFLRT